MRGRRRCNERARQCREVTEPQDDAQGRVGDHEGIRETRCKRVLVDSEASLNVDRPAGRDPELDLTRPLEQARLKCALQFRELRHADSELTTVASMRAKSRSVTSSASGGVLPSRSIIVATSPNSLRAAAYKSQTGFTIGWS